MIIGQCPVCGADMRVGSDMTNSDRIRSMTDEELAKWIIRHVSCVHCPLNSKCKYAKDCKEHWLEWLKQEAQCTSE